MNDNIIKKLKNAEFKERKNTVNKLEKTKGLDFFDTQDEITKEIWSLMQEQTKYNLVKKYGEEITDMPELKTNRPLKDSEYFEWYRYKNDLIVVFVDDNNDESLDVEKLFKESDEDFETLKNKVKKHINEKGWY